MRALRLIAGLFLVVGMSGAAHAQFNDTNKNYGVDIDEASLTPWQEIDTSPPAYPDFKNLIEFYVSAATSNKFFVDAKSLSVGTDSVIRYVVVITTPSGVNNVSFEGLHCDTYEKRVYALGRKDNSWSQARNKAWSKIPTVGPNSYQTVLFQDYFCPSGLAISTPEEGLNALRGGGHPSVK